MSIIERIVQIIDEKHLNQNELCKQLGIRNSTFSTWKTRNTDPPAKYILLICEFLNVSVDYLLGRTDEPKTETSDPTTQILVEHFNSLSSDDKIAVLNIVLEKSKK